MHYYVASAGETSTETRQKKNKEEKQHNDDHCQFAMSQCCRAALLAGIWLKLCTKVKIHGHACKCNWKKLQFCVSRAEIILCAIFIIHHRCGMCLLHLWALSCSKIRNAWHILVYFILILFFVCVCFIRMHYFRYNALTRSSALVRCSCVCV